MNSVGAQAVYGSQVQAVHDTIEKQRTRDRATGFCTPTRPRSFGLIGICR